MYYLRNILGTIINLGSNRVVKTKNLRWIIKKARFIREEKEGNSCLKNQVIAIIGRGWFIMKYNYSQIYSIWLLINVTTRCEWKKIIFTQRINSYLSCQLVNLFDRHKLRE